MGNADTAFRTLFVRTKQGDPEGTTEHGARVWLGPAAGRQERHGLDAERAH